MESSFAALALLRCSSQLSLTSLASPFRSSAKSSRAGMNCMESLLYGAQHKTMVGSELERTSLSNSASVMLLNDDEAAGGAIREASATRPRRVEQRPALSPASGSALPGRSTRRGSHPG